MAETPPYLVIAEISGPGSGKMHLELGKHYRVVIWVTTLKEQLSSL